MATSSAEGKRQRYWANRARVDEIKMASGCKTCGYCAHPAALDFDHRPGAIKVREVAAMVAADCRWSSIQAEIDKCDILCANCHRVVTFERRWDGQVRPIGTQGIS